FVFSSRRRHTRSKRDWSSDVCSSDLVLKGLEVARADKVIGNSLEAFITITPKYEQTKAVLESIPFCHQLLIVSDADVTEEAHARSEERRVGKESRTRRAAQQ